MKAKKYWILAVAIVSCAAFLSARLLAISISEQSQIKDYGISTLSGLKGICVDVKLSVNVANEDAGKHRLPFLTKNDLQTQVEIALRKAGIKVLSSIGGADDGFFVVAVGAMKESKDGPLYALTIQSVLIQRVTLLRNRKIETAAVTWPYIQTSTFGMTPSLMVERTIKDTVERQVNEFINDYLAANPKEPAKKKAPTLDELLEKAKPKVEQKQ